MIRRSDQKSVPGRGLTLLLGACLLLVTALPALAHNLLATAWSEGETVFVEGAFSNGDLAGNAEVTVFDEEGEILLTGRMDGEGMFSFAAPGKTALAVLVNAGMGHQTRTRITLEGDGGSPEEGADALREAVPSAAVLAPGSGLSAEELRRIIDAALDSKLRPVIRRLAVEADPGPSFQDILGGIGYIIGLVGLGAYYNYRRKLR